MNNQANQDICVCVLAYNEERHITRTLDAICQQNSGIAFDVIVYANGCSDRTAQVVRDYAQKADNVFVRELEIASKVNAWNTAYLENEHDILVFCDGDIVPEPGAIQDLYQLLTSNDAISLCCCESMPNYHGLPLSNRVIGFIQIPVCQDFLIGHCYAFKRAVISHQFKQRGQKAIPAGIVAEDAYIETLFPAGSFVVSKKIVGYDPPSYPDYIRYLARVRWQNEQLLLFTAEQEENSPVAGIPRFLVKLKRSGSIPRLLLGSLAHALKILFLLGNRSRINKAYERLGSVQKNGVGILSSATRSQSVK